MKKHPALANICCCLLLCLLPLLSLGQKKAALLSFTVKGLPEQVQRQMTPQAVDSLHSSLVRQLVRTHRLSSMIPQQPEKISFVAKGRQNLPKRLKAHQLVAGPDVDLYYQVIATLQNKTVFAGLQLPTVQVKMAVFDRTGKRLLLTESLGKDGIAHLKQSSDGLEEELNQDRFRKMYFRAVASLRTGGLLSRL